MCRRVVPVCKQNLPKVPAPGLEQLASHLVRYLVVGLDPHQVHEPLLLLEGHVLLVPLHKREQALVPEDGQGARGGVVSYPDPDSHSCIHPQLWGIRVWVLD